MKTATITIYVEHNCPVCNYVQKHILENMIARRDILSRKLREEGMHPLPLIDLKIVDINGTLGGKDEQFFHWYSQRVGGRFTPVILINNKAFYLWGEDKPRTIEKKHLSKYDMLRAQIIEELQTIYTTHEIKPFFEIQRIEQHVGEYVNATVHPFK